LALCKSPLEHFAFRIAKMCKLLAFALLSVAAATCDLTCSHATGIIVV
jgi:hypothetical protein